MEKGSFKSKYSKTLEDAFFRKQDQILIEQLHRMMEMKETKESLAKVSGITNEQILQKLVELDIRPEIAASLAIIPLIEVAWADGKVDEKEKAAVLDAAAKSFFADKNIDLSLLSQWLEHRPPRKLLNAWTHYVRGLCDLLTPGQKADLKNELIGHAHQIAQAAGGFLGLGNRVSEGERSTIEYLESVFE